MTGKARLLKISEAHAVGCRGNVEKSCPIWMINYLQDRGNYTGITSIDSAGGHWLLSSSSASSHSANAIGRAGYLTANDIYTPTIYGVRPVITVSRYDIRSDI